MILVIINIFVAEQGIEKLAGQLNYQTAFTVLNNHGDLAVSITDNKLSLADVNVVNPEFAVYLTSTELTNDKLAVQHQLTGKALPKIHGDIAFALSKLQVTEN